MNTKPNITLKRVERDCDFNKKPENAKKKLIDFDVYIDGERRATWWRWPGATRAYDLVYVDAKQAIRTGPGDASDIIVAFSQAAMLELTTKHLHRIPTMREYAARAAKQAEDRSHALAEAAPQLLAALKEMLAGHKVLQDCNSWVDINVAAVSAYNLIRTLEKPTA